MHDPMHVFFKLPRPVHRALEDSYSMLPPLWALQPFERVSEWMILPRYKTPAGSTSNTQSSNPRGKFLHFSDQKGIFQFRAAYLSTLSHPSALCDLCMTQIQGEWFRCCYCSRDLCDACEEVDTHDDTHVFIVFKSMVSGVVNLGHS